MAGNGASEMMQEQVMAAISDRYRARMQISTTMAAGPHPLPEQRLADLRMLQRVFIDEISELFVVLDGLELGDLSFLKEMPPGRLDELINASSTDWVTRLQGRPNMEAAAWAVKMAFEMPSASFSAGAGAAMKASDAAATAAREDLARLHI